MAFYHPGNLQVNNPPLVGHADGGCLRGRKNPGYRRFEFP
jgi:hypothetical protein